VLFGEERVIPGEPWGQLGWLVFRGWRVFLYLENVCQLGVAVGDVALLGCCRRNNVAQRRQGFVNVLSLLETVSSGICAGKPLRTCEKSWSKIQGFDASSGFRFCLRGR
jgi:hypothetical protein